MKTCLGVANVVPEHLLNCATKFIYKNLMIFLPNILSLYTKKKLVASTIIQLIDLPYVLYCLKHARCACVFELTIVLPLTSLYCIIALVPCCCCIVPIHIYLLYNIYKYIQHLVAKRNALLLICIRLCII